MMQSDESGLVSRLADGDVRALARAISVVEDGGAGAEEVLRGCGAVRRRARRIGVTGPPGAGKSTLVDGMVRWLRSAGERVGVVAVDPTSPYTGGALLGDRIRMQGFAEDSGVYIRSMASRGAMGGVARAAAAVCAVMEAAGFGTVIVETVGVGQDEVEVARLADATVLVLVPGLGDDVQSLKAGVMEAADVFVVNKSDLPGAEGVVAEILSMQGLAAVKGNWAPPVVRTVATAGVGVGELMGVVERFLAGGRENGRRRNTGVLRSAQDDVSVRAGDESDVGVEPLSIDHLGVAVRSIAAAKGFYEMLGLRVGGEETVEHEQVRTAMLPVGTSRIELLEATAEDSTIGRFVAKRGEGLHHVALRVTGIEERFERMQAAGVRLASDRVRVGAGGHRYFFVHPESTGGVLVELVEG